MMKRLNVASAFLIAILITLPFDAIAWNIPDHMLSGAIAYQIPRWENPATIKAVWADSGNASMIREPLAWAVRKTA